MLAMPRVIVRKITGAMTIRTRFTKVSPTGLIARPALGQPRPRRMPKQMATRTWTVRFRWGERIGGTVYGAGPGFVSIRGLAVSRFSVGGWTAGLGTQEPSEGGRPPRNRQPMNVARRRRRPLVYSLRYP